MKHPQSLAAELYSHFQAKNLKSIKEYGCCAFVLMWCLGIEPDDDAEAVMTVDSLIQAKALKEDCTVKWAEAIRQLTGREMRAVDFVNITSILHIKDRCPVRYDHNGKSHWVGVENGKIAFNPLKRSVCVESGKPSTMRIIHIKGIDG
ncbi:hypothetical protein [Treponema succinifaciens]|uniref:hypothetical protein n=1 Tax=Treponema succinifaciens TaxID=167 RepID=UPI003FCE496F